MKRAILAFSMLLATTSVAAPQAADACGGMFCNNSPSEQIAATGHRMAISVQSNESILWDQIQYAGRAETFSWILPVWGDVTVEVASAAFFDELEATTAVRIQAPQVQTGCPAMGGGFGCGASAFSAPGASSDSGSGGSARDVTVINTATVGPYETVTLRGTDADALATWLTEHGYVVPPSIQPVIQYYTERHMDFLALRLRPGEGIQAMQPIRVRYRSANMVLPLRMVAAGAVEKVGLTLWVFGSGRYETANFANARVMADDVTWNWDTSSSNYPAQFRQAVTHAGGRAWVTEFAQEATAARGRTSRDASMDWTLATGQLGNPWVTRLRTELLLEFLDNDLQLQASSDVSTVSNVLRVTRTSGTSPAVQCGNIATIATPRDVIDRPLFTMFSVAASLLALIVARRRKPR